MTWDALMRMRHPGGKRDFSPVCCDIFVIDFKITHSIESIIYAHHMIRHNKALCTLYPSLHKCYLFLAVLFGIFEFVTRHSQKSKDWTLDIKMACNYVLIFTRKWQMLSINLTSWHGYFPHYRPFEGLCFYPDKAIEQIVELLMIWDAFMLISRHFNVVELHKYK